MRRLLILAAVAVVVSACEVPTGNERAFDPKAGYSSVARLAGKAATGKALELADPSCSATGACVCKGAVDDAVRGELARSAKQLETGVACLAADFDSNGTVDFVIPVGEGVAVILLNGAAGVERHLTLDVGGEVALAVDKKTLRADVEGIERTWAWSGQGFAYSEKPKG